MNHLALALLAAAAVAAAAEPPPQGAALLKTDLMFVGAHPDDETGLAATLARYAGQGKTVAAVYCTRGEGGGNMVGTQAGAALGVLREAELRRCLARLGVTHVYFVDEEDFFYTESLAATLERWDKPDVLGKLVRVVRSLRPEVILTMNPAPNPGQHGHHQAAGILATEAFAAAADPRAYPDQLTREGLQVWQTRKLYYGSGSERSVKIRTDEPIRGGAFDGKVPADMAALALAEHRSQAFGNIGNSPWLRRPQSFLLARAAVKIAEPEADLFDNLDGPAGADPFNPAQPEPEALAFVPRPAIASFIEWARKHRVLHTAAGFAADVPVRAGEVNAIAFEGAEEARASIEAKGWEIAGMKEKKVLVRVPSDAREDAELVLRADEGKVSQSSALQAKVRLHPVPVARVARRGREANRIEIGTNLVAQGRAPEPADCSGAFTVAWEKDYFLVDVSVRDDAVVSNIEPNDIKGHWRSDSVEICIDPEAGAEHTARAFKVGIFPFDTTGKVRAARDADANQGPVERTAPSMKLVSERTGDGYRIRAFIPWSATGVKPKKGATFGFNVIIYDGDKRDAAPGENINETRLAWSPRPGVQGRPEDWGRLVLD